MASSSGTSSGSISRVQNAGSEEDLQQLMDQRKRKRKISNRESARRSRIRRQKHLDDLTAQVARLGKEKNQFITGISVTTQHYLNVEAENSVLRAQVAELSHRLHSLNEIVSSVNASNGFFFGSDQEHYSATAFDQPTTDFFTNSSWGYNLCLNQPIILGSADMLYH